MSASYSFPTGRHEYEYGATRVLAGKLVRICVEIFANSGMYNNKGLVHSQMEQYIIEQKNLLIGASTVCQYL